MSAIMQAPSTFPSTTSIPRYGRESADAFGDYLRTIGRKALLTAEDEVTLARRIEVGLFADAKLQQGLTEPTLQRELAWLAHDGQRAKNHFIEANLRLVVSIAKNYSGRGVPIMDLVQDGNMGLIRAVEKFDFMTGYKFSTYATWWIRQSIHRGLADKSRLIRIAPAVFAVVRVVTSVTPSIRSPIRVIRRTNRGRVRVKFGFSP